MYQYTASVYSNGSESTAQCGQEREYILDQSASVSEIVELVIADTDRNGFEGDYEVIVFFHYANTIRRAFVQVRKPAVPMQIIITN
jgi:hypothetical protein